MKKLFFLITLFCLSAGYSHAQEICNDNLDNDENGLVDCLDPAECPTKTCEICDNGIDDDGDRFIDCYDKECVLSNVCKDFFIGKTDSCNVKPEIFPPFEMKLKYKSQPGTANHVNRLIVGDVDNDGIPELVTTFRTSSSNAGTAVVNVMQAPTAGMALNIDKQIDMKADGFQPSFEDIAMADINKDGCSEYFILHTNSDGNGYKLVGYDCTGKLIWNNKSIDFPEYPGTIGLTDFDGDGAVELYLRSQIYDAHTGTLMGENLFNNAFGQSSNAPIAANILTASPGQELIAGCRIYTVNINRPAAPGATLPTAVTPPVKGSTLTLTKSVSNYFVRRGRTSGSGTSIADFNLDGFLDVLAIGSTIDDSDNSKQTTTAYFWDVEHNVIKTFTDNNAVAGDNKYKFGWQNGAGRINIADIDGDGKMNAVYVSGRYLYALKEGAGNMEVLWRENVTEQTSGITGCTMFDFNADGKSEIVYRDEDYLYIFTTTLVGSTANVTRSTPIRCASRTSNEYPIVADMNGDGSTEICVVCASDDSQPGADMDLYSNAEVRVYESANVPWVPARKVWNQHGYFVVNVNDDLTIPKQIQQHHLVYSDNAECFVDKKSRPLNNFLNQAPFLNSYGCPSYAAPNLSVVPFDPSDPTAPQLKIDAPTCPDKNIGVTFKFRNKGDVLVSGGLKITFYNGDPRTNSAVKMSTTTITLSEMAPGDTITQKVTIAGNGSPFTLYVVLNDDGTTIPLDIEKQPGRIRECDYGDNVLFAPVNPGLAALTTTAIDNLKCLTTPGGVIIPDKGIAKAYGPGKDSLNYTFYWFDGHDAGAPGTADHVGFAYSGLAAGEYTVYAVHKTAKCGSDTAHVIIGQQDAPKITVTIDPISQLTNCKNPNGHLRAVLSDPTKYDITWFPFSLSDTLGFSPDLTGLSEGSYTVWVQDKTTGCVSLSTAKIEKIAPLPVITTKIDTIKCSNANSGRIDALADGKTTGYTFHWYNGSTVKPTPDKANSPFYNNLKAQKYTVRAINNTSECESKLTVTLTQTTPPKITSLVKDDQLSCDKDHPTGEATVTATAATTPVVYQWYTGNSTADVNKITGATSATVTGLKAGLYTINVVESTTGCSKSDTIRVLDSRKTVVVVPTPTPKSSCAPANGKIEITSVNSGALSDYTFIWTNISDDPETTLPDTDGTVEGLEPGSYQVVAVHTEYTCRSLPVTVKVANNTPKMVLTNPNLKAASTCQNSNDGIFTVEVIAPTTPSKFNFAWYNNDGISLHERLGVLRDSIINSTGLYSVKITNPENGCDTTAYATIPFEQGHTIDVTYENVAKCAPHPGGAIHVTLNHTLGYDDVDYDILLYRTNKDPDAKNSYLTHSPPFFTGLIPSAVPPVAGKFDKFDLEATTVGTNYTVVAVNKTLPLQGCRYAQVITIRRTGVKPVIDATLSGITANMNCDASLTDGTGGISIAVKHNEAAADPANYSFAWTNEDISPPNNNEVDAAKRFGINNKDLRFMVDNEEGYKVVFTTITPLNEGCSNSAIFEIPSIEQDLRVADGDFKTQAITQCVPGSPTSAIMTNGSAEFVALQKDNVPVAAPFTGFTFSWLNRATNTLLPSVTNPIVNLDSGKYTAMAKYTDTGCNVSFDFVIQDSTLGTVDVVLESFRTEIMCVDPVTGFLEVKALPETGQNYEFTWFGYNNSGVRNPVPVQGPVLGTSNTLANQLSVNDFTVRVLNPNNNCWMEDTYTVPMDTIKFFVSASSLPITNCVNVFLTPNIHENGSVFARISSAGVLPPSDPLAGTPRPIIETNYRYEWYDEHGDPITPVNAGRSLENLTSEYANRDLKVVAFDLNDTRPACKSDTAIVRLEKVLPTLPITTQILAAVSNCDETIPNGMASASVNGDIVNYQFSWFEDPATHPLNPVTAFRTDFMAENLQRADFTYTILAIDLISGCMDSTTLTIPYEPLPVPIPTIEILSQVTSCIENNGALAASVGGNIQDYIFRWYDDTVTKPDTDLVSPDAYGDLRDTLAAQIPYGVIAVDRATKCESNLVYETLQFTPTYPEFDLQVTPASCGHPDGTVSLVLKNNVDIAEIIWEIEGGTPTNEPIQEGLQAGKNYIVTVITQLGCQDTAHFAIGTEIHPFNGISRNGDDRNSYFHIDCIEEFGSNVVRIYNRAGTLVYQADGYDNNTVLFDGLSNRGISPMGNNLPDGTYFYVIDKRNGSKPLAGYLEIVN
ncbi:gliding motility-associated C-terminal domain-containing protein [Fulvivirgaceae bacterium PWU5]|uniref:Gliding motility-associated C-terminal domain-containing protein n=1 Tax=Dawidia cretensis TaxID=2782350 RepID=A0AAP2GST2_9BACT|nr:gliding motility-associated C-terminal domain-containing protein [Dawidia cretensis]MBT1707533.1 gliding motility-associated C-terminal domain-containing protein [Dawidia cretensis]